MQKVKTVFMFPGQGSQYPQMGRELFANHKVFRHWMEKLDRLAREVVGRSIVETIYSAGKHEILDRTLITHPAIFMVEYALSQCLLSEGIEPDLTLGASLGSFAAAALAGHLDIEDALAAVIQQAIAFENTCARGGMIAVLARRELLGQSVVFDLAEFAADNFATHFAIAAPEARLGDIEAELRSRDVAYQRLPVSFAFHSRWSEPAQFPFEAFMRLIPRRRCELPVVCCQQAVVLDILPNDFFWRVVRAPIRLRDTITKLEEQGPYRYIDVGPSSVMATFAKYIVSPSSKSTMHKILTPYGQDQQNLTALHKVY
ncbi:acyltransferase domain-containing protein [Agrobacterium vitis]|uniref:Acyltransferase domain-containing protein n=1 Tax=Agrobacterium vitis TaxID=373 RepID=A0A7K1RFR2_AGRVI|nr:acyltransferase domain-containing protein [Agrobacterium vitis]MVA56841.1 acyltransferase domain-containing protein [Agrobacterium vitis]